MTAREFEIPPWITKEFIQKAIENNENPLGKIIVESFEVDMPIPKGTNMGSDIFGVKAKYKSLDDLSNLNEISFIIKAQVNGEISETVAEMGITDKEVLAYSEFAPKLNELLHEYHGVIEDDEILPKSFYSSEKDVIILEDLKCKGYKMADKVKRLDYDHCVIALKALAKFHASSLKIRENDRDLIDKLSKELLYTGIKGGKFADFLDAGMKVFSDECKNWPKLEKYSKWFHEISVKIWDLISENVNSKENEFNVLNHGDFWTANMLFKYCDHDNDKPLKVKLIDLQVCRYTSPVLDFIELIDTSVQEDVRTNKFDELIIVYLNELNSNLEKFGISKRMSETEFKKSLHDRKYFRILCSTNFLAGMIADPNEVYIMERKDFSWDSLNDSDNINNPLKLYFRNPRFLDIVTKRLLEFEKSGYIKV